MRLMRRITALIAVLTLVLAACGGGGETSSPTETAGETSAPTTSTTTEAPAESDSTAPGATSGATDSPAPDRVTPDGPAAPDFELALGSGGGVFSLSGEQKPVYVVFWAEW